MYTVNPELLRMARQEFEKSAVVPSDAAMQMGGGGGMPMGGAPPDPSQLGVQGAAQPVDPATAAMGAAPPPGADPTGAATMAAPPSPAAPPPGMGAPPPGPAAGANPAQQKIKPEQMMQMLDFRLYNMQQQLTAIMNAMGVQVDPATLVLPPGNQGAPPAETALPGGSMAPPPPQQDPSAPAGPPAPGGPVPPGGPMDPSQMPPDPNAGKQASWWAAPAAKFVEANSPPDLQALAAAAKIMLRNL
jgi:hypothetical protein